MTSVCDRAVLIPLRDGNPGWLPVYASSVPTCTDELAAKYVTSMSYVFAMR